MFISVEKGAKAFIVVSFANYSAPNGASLYEMVQVPRRIAIEG
jgi:hypothetical protein